MSGYIGPGDIAAALGRLLWGRGMCTTSTAVYLMPNGTVAEDNRIGHQILGTRRVWVDCHRRADHDPGAHIFRLPDGRLYRWSTER